MKTCTKCHQAKPLTDFHAHRGGTRPDCKACGNALYRAAYAAGKREPSLAQKTVKAEKWRAHYYRHRSNRLEQYRADTAELADSYVRRKLVRDTSLNSNDVPQALVNLKREHLRFARVLKEAENHEEC